MLLPIPGFNACLAHQRPRLAPTDWVAQGVQAVLHPSGTVAEFAAFGDVLHGRNHRLVLGIRQPVPLTLAIPIIGIATDTQESAHDADWPGLLVLGNERVLQRVSLAKKTVAFLRSLSPFSNDDFLPVTGEFPLVQESTCHYPGKPAHQPTHAL